MVFERRGEGFFLGRVFIEMAMCVRMGFERRKEGFCVVLRG